MSQPKRCQVKLKTEEEPITGLSIPQGQEACLFNLVFLTPVFPSSSPEVFAGKKCWTPLGYLISFPVGIVDSVQFSSVTQSCPIPCDPMNHSTPGLHHLSITNSQSLLKLMSIKSVMPSNHLILCHPLLLLPPIPPSIRVFSNESTFHMRWPKYWSFSFSISPSNEHPGLTSFRMDWLDLLAVQGTLKSLLQHHRSKASILRRSAFFTVQLSHPYMTTGKTIALTRQTFVVD